MPLFSAGDLPTVGERVMQGIRDSGHFEGMSERNRQVLAIAEECGEFVGAFRRWSGQARRTGTWQQMEDELADIIITAFATAYVFDMDIAVIIERKLGVIFHRGWKGPSHDVPT